MHYCLGQPSRVPVHAIAAKNSSFYGCVFPSIWIYLNRACLCFPNMATVQTSMGLVSAREAASF
jgi:hypothetical protein